MNPRSLDAPLVEADANRPTSRQRVCVRCVMDDSDPEIDFDAEGVCNHCHLYRELAARYLLSDAERESGSLERLVITIRKASRGKAYDVVAGVSGGVDSTYAVYRAKQLGLRPLAVHFDNGWNSELAVANIERTLNALDIDLQTYVMDWEEFRDLQLSFLKASVINAEIPTDHAINALLYRTAAEQGIKYILTGSNVATEAVLPPAWVYNNKDFRFIRSLHDRFGTRKLKRFPRLTLPRYIYYVYGRGIRLVPILNYVGYDKAHAKEVISRELGWRDYGGKHRESIYTLFYQSYILPRKFGVDKRRAHLSALICSGQLTREEALAELDRDELGERELGEYRDYVITKLGISEAEFEEIMARPVKTFRDYPSNARVFAALRRLNGLVADRRLRAVGVGAP